MRRLCLFITPLLGLLFTACGNDAQTSSSKIIFDDSKIELVSKNERDSSGVLRAVGSLMEILVDPANPEVKFVYPKCSAFQISRVHILTAGHCDGGKKLVFDKNQISSDLDLDKLEFLNLGQIIRLVFDGEMIPQASQASKNPILEVLYHDEELDIVVYRSSKSLGMEFINLSKHESHVAIKGDGLKLFGFPNGVPLTKSADCQITASAGDGLIRHDCDALQGSSGALMVSTDNKALAVHLGGPGFNDPSYYEANQRFESTRDIQEQQGCYTLDDSGKIEECVKEFAGNKAILISQVVQQLKTKNTELWNKIKAATCDQGI